MIWKFGDDGFPFSNYQITKFPNQGLQLTSKCVLFSCTDNLKLSFATFNHIQTISQ